MVKTVETFLKMHVRNYPSNLEYQRFLVENIMVVKIAVNAVFAHRYEYKMIRIRHFSHF